MNNMLYISRSFVEFGPFSPSEISGFKQRGILKDTDYVRHSTGDDWIHVNDWAAAEPVSASVSGSTAVGTAKKSPAPKEEGSSVCGGSRRKEPEKNSVVAFS